MNAIDGWIFLERKIVYHWIWTDPQFGFRWVDLLLMASFSPSRIVVENKGIDCERGDIVTTRAYLADRWHTSPSTVGRFLHLLEQENMIRFKRDSRLTHISICNYDTYQNSSRKNGAKVKTVRRNDDATLAQVRCDDDAYLKEGKEGNVENKEKKVEESSHSLSSFDDTEENVSSFFLSFFNSTMEGKAIHPIRSLEGKRLKKLCALIKEYGRDGVIKMIEIAAKSDFLNGGGDKGWVASFDWMMEPSKFLQIIEGSYSNNGKRKNNGGATPERSTATDDEIAQIDADYLARSVNK